MSIYNGSKKNTNLGTNKNDTTSNTPTPVSGYTTEPQLTIPTIKATPTSGKSYGVFYPFSEGVTINNDLPTIIGKVTQNSDIYLDTKFGIENSPVSGEDENFLRFIPGRIKNLKVKVDGV